MLRYSELSGVLQRLDRAAQLWKTRVIETSSLRHVLFDRGTWTFSITVVESNDHTFIWVSSPLTQIPDAAQASPQALLKLMDAPAQKQASADAR